MCTVIVLRQRSARWPLIMAANRDERLDRRWDAPARYWPHLAAGITGGRDATAGGTWMGMNRAGVVAAVLNRPGSLGPDPRLRSRGELPLLALAAGTAWAAAARIAALDAGRYRPFHLVVMDAADAFFLAGLGAGRPETTALPPGVSMVTAHPPNDLTSPRTARHLPRFQAARAPASPELADWADWPGLLADGAGTAAEALNVSPIGGFGTLCSSLVALGARGERHWHFAPGPPDRTAFAPIAV